jgi:dolichol-phosphate mannosyltransferase
LNNQQKISIVIPSFNEEGNIAVMIAAIDAVFVKLEYSYEMIFVDVKTILWRS